MTAASVALASAALGLLLVAVGAGMLAVKRVRVRLRRRASERRVEAYKEVLRAAGLGKNLNGDGPLFQDHVNHPQSPIQVFGVSRRK